MKTKSPYAFGLAVLLSLLISIPADIWAAPQAGQRAGEVSRVIPAVSIVRGSKNITASAKTAVDWQDLVNTQVNARARIALEDGSVLNVGSESSMKVVKHDAGAQQTELELTYGKLRTQAQKIAKPDGKFEVRTPAGVAGVVGTDFFVEYSNNIMNVIAFEGIVKVCNLAGVCVLLKAGQMTNVRNGDNSGPMPPTQVGLDVLVATSKDTDVTGQLGLQGTGPHLGPWGTTAIFVAIPAIIIPIIVTHRTTGTLVPPPPPPQKGCSPNNPAGC
jgi:hypothetical protein